MRDWSGKLAGFTETGTEKTGDLLDERVGGDEGIILAGQLLDELLVLVEFLQVIGRHSVDAMVFGAINIVLVSENAGVDD